MSRMLEIAFNCWNNSHDSFIYRKLEFIKAKLSGSIYKYKFISLHFVFEVITLATKLSWK